MAAVLETLEVVTVTDGTRAVGITVPPEEAARIRTDPPYAQKVFENTLKGMQEEALNEPSNEVDDDNSRHSALDDASVNEDEPESQPSGSKTTFKAAGLLWTDAWTKQLSDLYTEYIDHVGLEKKFKTNKEMWRQIANDINAVHNTAITGQQCDSRFKTIKYRQIKEKYLHRISVAVWDDGQTKKLLDLYAKYVKQVGPTCKFKTSREMWRQIARSINAVYSTAVTAQQCERRFKTVQRRKIKEKYLKHTFSSGWTEGWTNQLLSLYAKFVKQVGPKCKFKSNRDMWRQIARNINAVHNTALTGQQCESRFKTVKRRKIKETYLEHASVEAAVATAHHYEWEQDESQDEIIIPELLLEKEHYVSKTPPSSSYALRSRSSSSQGLKPKRDKTSAEILEEGINRLLDAKEQYEKIRSEGKERRHQEELALLRELLLND